MIGVRRLQKAFILLRVRCVSHMYNTRVEYLVCISSVLPKVCISGVYLICTFQGLHIRCVSPLNPTMFDRLIKCTTHSSEVFSHVTVYVRNFSDTLDEMYIHIFLIYTQ